MKKTKQPNPIIAYGLIVLSLAWMIAAVIISFKYESKSFLIISFLGILGLLSAISGVILAARLLPDTQDLKQEISDKDSQIANLITISCLTGYILPLANLLIPFFVWRKHYKKSKFIHDTGYYAINFQLAIALFLATALMLCPLAVGFLILPVIILMHLVFVIVAIIKTRQKQVYIYPGNLKFFPQKNQSST